MTDVRALLVPFKDRLAAATPGPWTAWTTGTSGGDHWFVATAGCAIAQIHADDVQGDNRRKSDAVFMANAPTDLARLLAAIEAVVDACDRVITNADGHKPPGPPHPTREQGTALRIRAALAAALGSDTTMSAQDAPASVAGWDNSVINAPRDCDHVWETAGMVFETQLLDAYGRVQVRQPDLDAGRVYFICRQCASHTYMTTQWIGYRLHGSEDAGPAAESGWHRALWKVDPADDPDSQEPTTNQGQ
ncbi:hypothetical protein [Paenarthrobacter nitroguajacolicus]|uniref:hypothetical protein n=1 Tax=Paenarthrobacter nitroguajacolicus TaxID=211146 RepID=UPI001C4BDE2B|nr:hypothetical protein [Paenarthrobacter nitroguajacolicus]